MSEHNHPDAAVLTFGCDACITAANGLRKVDRSGLSAGQRLTLRNNEMLTAGRHPATGRSLDADHTCGECVHHKTRSHDRTWHKCELHRLGMSHSASSDIRVGWPACSAFEGR